MAAGGRTGLTYKSCQKVGARRVEREKEIRPHLYRFRGKRLRVKNNQIECTKSRGKLTNTLYSLYVQRVSHLLTSPLLVPHNADGTTDRRPGALLRKREREREREKERERKKEKDRKKERKRERERETHTHTHKDCDKKSFRQPSLRDEMPRRYDTTGLSLKESQ